MYLSDEKSFLPFSLREAVGFLVFWELLGFDFVSEISRFRLAGVFREEDEEEDEEDRLLVNQLSISFFKKINLFESIALL